MAEVIALIGSVITIVAAVKSGVKRARALYQASEELEALQEQIEGFTRLVNEIDAQPVNSLSNTVLVTLSRAKLTLEQLDQLVTFSLLKEVDGTFRARRSAWPRHRSKVYRFRDALKEHRLNLLAAISVNTLFYATQAEATSLSLDRRLYELQRSLSITHHALLSQSNAVNCILHSFPPGSTAHLGSAGQPELSHRHGSPGFIKAAADDDAPRNQEQISAPQNLRHSTTAASPFDALRNFFPETYTSHQRVPQFCLLVMQSYEELTTCNLRSNVYKVFYLKSPRQWCRLIISIQIHRSSIYWPATKTAQHENARPLVGSASLPYSLINAIQDFLRAENVEDDNSLQFSLTGDDSIQKQQCKSRSKLSAMVTKFSSAVPTALAFLDDLGCRQYFESEVTQVELHDESYFISCIGGKLVYEVKFANPVPSCELLYNIRVLHCMNGVSSFPNLVGVVVDDSGKYLKSYCLEFPKARKNLSQALEDLSVPWAQRERWAKQLVEGVSQLHDRGFVVGTLLADRSTVIIEESNSIQFWYLKSRFHAGNSHISGYYPPEFRHLSKLSRTTNENQCPNISSKTDIYHLGLALWRIVETSSGKNSSPICARKRCNQEAGPCKDQSHFDPITLPRLHGSIPTYYQKIVDACRAEDPNNRPAARRLLEKFPVTTQALPCFTCETPGPEITDLVAMGDCLKGTVTCDRCRERSIRLPFFHCNVCLTGDYDICHACYVKGAHCKDTTHLLVEMTKVGSLIVAGKYHSDVKSSGRRDILEL